MKFLKSREAILLAAIVVLTGGIALRFPAFITPHNLANVFNDTAPLMILAVGQMIVILTKCIDLSIAATLAMTGMVAALLNGMGVPLPLIIGIAVGLGAVMGAVNGLLVWRLGIPSIVVTLGTMTIYRGLIFLLTNGKWVNAHEMTDAFKSLPRMVVLGLPIMGWIAIVMIALFAVIMARTALGSGLIFRRKIVGPFPAESWLIENEQNFRYRSISGTCAKFHACNIRVSHPLPITEGQNTPAGGP